MKWVMIRNIIRIHYCLFLNLGIILCCMKLNFAILQKNVCALETAHVYNVTGNGKLIFVTVFTSHAVLMENIKLIN